MSAARPSASSPVRRRPPSSGRLEALDGLRGAAALSVLLVHVWMFDRGDDGGARTAVDVAISQLRLSMPLFFVLSGFLIFRPFAAALIDARPLPDLGSYALRRAARVVPAYWLAILATAVLLVAIGHPFAVGAIDLPRFLLFLQNYSTATVGRLNPPTWTIAVEATFYLAVPLLVLGSAGLVRRGRTAARRRTILAVGCAALLVAGAAAMGWTMVTGAGPTYADSLPARFGSFGAGMLAAVLVHGRRLDRGAATALAAAGLALVLLEAAVHGLTLGSRELRQATLDTAASCGFGMIIAAFALGRPVGGGLLARGPLRWTGTVSYGLYLAHFPVIFALRSFDAWPSGLLAAALLTATIGLLLATASWHLLEKPAIAWAHRRTPGRSGARRPSLAGAGAGD